MLKTQRHKRVFPVAKTAKRGTTLRTLTLAITLLGAPALADDWSLKVDQLNSINRTDRDVDITAFTLSRPSKAQPFGEVGMQGGFMVIRGRSSEDGGASYQPADANAVFWGGYARFAPAAPSARFQPFLEVGAAAVATDRNVPRPLSPGDPRARFYAKLDARFGASVTVSNTLALEGSAVINHTSNGLGIGSQNLNFDGVGLSLGLTRKW